MIRLTKQGGFGKKEEFQSNPKSMDSITMLEIIAHGQKIAICDSQDTAITGTVFQIDVRMKREEDVKRAYEILKEGSKTNVPLGPSFFSPCMVDFVDKFGVRWCLFAE
jgi:PhnB protein